jgi:hypothetical protein
LMNHAAWHKTALLNWHHIRAVYSEDGHDRGSNYANIAFKHGVTGLRLEGGDDWGGAVSAIRSIRKRPPAGGRSLRNLWGRIRCKVRQFIRWCRNQTGVSRGYVCVQWMKSSRNSCSMILHEFVRPVGQNIEGRVLNEAFSEWRTPDFIPSGEWTNRPTPTRE